MYGVGEVAVALFAVHHIAFLDASLEQDGCLVEIAVYEAYSQGSVALEVLDFGIDVEASL